MVNYYIYAKDYSFSTNGVAYYHDNGIKTFEQFKSDVNEIICTLSDLGESRIIYLHWGHECVEVSEKTCFDTYKSRQGKGYNTLPETIIQWIKKNIDLEYGNKIKLLYIITDGQIDDTCVNQCLILNEGVDYEDVVFHAFRENLKGIDLSVAASFIKRNCSIYRNNELLDETDVSKQFNYSKITIDNFRTEKNNLKSYIKFKYLTSPPNGASAVVEIDKLEKLRTRLLSCLSSDTETIPDIADKNAFIDAFKKTNWYRFYSDPIYNFKVEVDKSISTLIKYILTEKKSYAFDALKFDATFHINLTEEPAVDINFTDDEEIKFPNSILDDEKAIPVILCTKLNLLDKLIFQSSASSANFSNFRFLMECPLFLINDTDLNESMGYFYTLTVYKLLIKKATKLEPRTRRPFHGGIVLVETDEFDEYNDYILSATYFNSKKVKYNTGLFYYILWKICKSKKWMDQGIIERFRKYILRRICNTQCKIGLSSLPLDPQVDTSLPMALWYCVEIASDLFKNDSNLFPHERLRVHYSVAHSMIEILNYLEYNIDIDAINNRKDLIGYVMLMKQIPRPKDKLYYLLEKIFKKVNGFLVADLENPGNIKKLNYLKLNSKEMLDDNIATREVNLEDYVHFLHRVDHAKVKICKKTLRPYFMISQHECFYSELYKITKKVIVSNVDGQIGLKYDAIDHLDFARIFSAYNLYLHCVKDCNKYPTLNEYTEYIQKKKKFYQNLITIFPINVYKVIEDTFHIYQSLIRGVGLTEFIEMRDKYVDRFERIKAEKKGKFENDDKIIEFICKEECKVNLIKLDQFPKKN